jgi:hypothetical protein
MLSAFCNREAHHLRLLNLIGCTPACLSIYERTPAFRQESFLFSRGEDENEAIMPVTIPCAVCGAPIKTCPSHVPRRATCSKPCRIAWQRKFEIEPDELLLAVWTEPVTQLRLLLMSVTRPSKNAANGLAPSNRRADIGRRSNMVRRMNRHCLRLDG